MKTQINKEIIMALFVLMLNYENVISKGNKSRIFSLPENAKDSVIHTEDWMLDDKKWNSPIKAVDLEIDNELQLIIEDWMVDDKVWSQSLNKESEIKDKELKVEDWMLDSRYWAK